MRGKGVKANADLNRLGLFYTKVDKPIIEVTLTNTSHFGGAEENRTPDLLRARQTLSQLSYSPILIYISRTIH
jgi:hypothetical protein